MYMTLCTGFSTVGCLEVLKWAGTGWDIPAFGCGCEDKPSEISCTMYVHVDLQCVGY